MADNFSRSKKQTRMSFLHQNRAANVPYVPVNFLKVSVAVIFYGRKSVCHSTSLFWDLHGQEMLDHPKTSWMSTVLKLSAMATTYHYSNKILTSKLNTCDTSDCISKPKIVQIFHFFKRNWRTVRSFANKRAVRFFWGWPSITFIK